MGGKQLGFSDFEITAKKQTKQETFRSEMEAVVSWQELIALIEPHYYPKASKKGGRPPYPLTAMLRIHLLLQLYSLSDPAMEAFLIEVPTMRCFAGIELISDRIMGFRDVARGPRSGRSISASTRTPA